MLRSREGCALDRVHRRLATVLAADAAGFSRLTGRDEEGAIATLRALRQTIDRLIEQHGGRVFGSVGDSVIAEFTSSCSKRFAAPLKSNSLSTNRMLELD